MKGKTCSHRSSYDIIRIHEGPYLSLKAAHRIQISTKRTPDCSFACPLNVAIWEIITIGSGTQLRYHGWAGIYHLTWKVIAASYKGFSLHITLPWQWSLITISQENH